MSKSEVGEVWLRQPYDTRASYQAFFDTFLAQDPPRTLNEAYRRYLRQKGPQSGQDRASFEDEVAHKQAPGNWRRWYRGQNASGEAIEGAKTWAERADAYDDDRRQKTLAELEERRLQAQVETADLGRLLRQKAHNAARLLVAVEQRAGADAAGREIVVLEVKMSPHEISRMAEVGVALERLALGESTERQEHTGEVHFTPDLSRLSDDDLRKLADIAARLSRDQG
jgi:hypothetical protein